MELGYLLTLPDIKVDMLSDVVLSECSKFSNIYELNILNNKFKYSRAKYDLACTYNGYVIISERFKAFCEKENYENLEFIRLPLSPSYYWFKINNILEFDAVARDTQFLNYNQVCKGYEEIIGATPVYLKVNQLIPDNFF